MVGREGALHKSPVEFGLWAPVTHPRRVALLQEHTLAARRRFRDAWDDKRHLTPPYPHRHQLERLDEFTPQTSHKFQLLFRETIGVQLRSHGARVHAFPPPPLHQHVDVDHPPVRVKLNSLVFGVVPTGDRVLPRGTASDKSNESASGIHSQRALAGDDVYNSFLLLVAFEEYTVTRNDTVRGELKKPSRGKPDLKF